MTLPIEIDGPREAPASGGPAKQLVILLHGLGAGGDDLIGLAPVLSQILPDAAFVSPNAPFPCDMAPMGLQWFSLQSRSPASLQAGVEGARGILDRFIDAELEKAGLNASDLVLIGFSQGTMMALHTGLRRSDRLAGIIGYSGVLIGAERLSQEIASRPPVLLVHGDADEVVPFAMMTAAEQALTELKVPTKAFRRPGLGHGIDQEGLRLAAAFLLETFGLSMQAAPAP